MKYTLTLTLTLLTLISFAQIPVDPTLSVNSATRLNAAIVGSISSTSAANTYTATLANITAYPPGFDVTFAHGNTGSATFNLNSIGALTMKKWSSGSLVNLVSGDISDNQRISFYYDGTFLIMKSAASAGGGAGTWGSITGTLSSQSDLQTALNAKQATLVSATNIKTINGTSILGSGDLTVTGSGGGGGTSKLTPNTQTTSYTPVLSDTGKVIRMNVAIANNLSLPTNASVPYAIGTFINGEQVGVGPTTVVAPSGGTLTGPAGGTLTAPGQGVPFVCWKTGTNAWELWNGGQNGWLTSGTTTLLGNTAHSGSFTNTAATDSELIVQNNLSGTGKPALKITPGFHTNLTAATEFNSFSIEPFTQQWANGVTLQRFNYIKSPTVSSVIGTTFGTTYNVYIDPVIAGTNAGITNNYALGVNGKSNFTDVMFGTIITVNNKIGSNVFVPNAAGQTFFSVDQTSTGGSLFFGGLGAYTQTSGSYNLVKYNNNITVSSGNANFNYMQMNGTLNGTGNSGTWTGLLINPIYTAWDGNIIGYDYNPTVTSVSGTHIAQRILSGSILFGDPITATAATASTRVDQIGLGTTSSTINHRWANSSNSQIAKLTDDGSLILSGTLTASGGTNYNITTQSTSRSLNTSDNGTFMYCTNGSGITISIPVALPVGYNFRCTQGSTGGITITGLTSTTVIGTGLTTTAGQIVEVVCVATNIYIVNTH